MSMCDELGPKGGLMQAYVEEAGKTSLCSIKEPYSGCSEKEVKFIKKASDFSADDISKQTERLNRMKDGKMTDDLKLWVNQRLKILQKLGSVSGKDEL
eukprot:m.332752 g.332752  ORF g.332752 m.332752 type:complete len:98 (+) comp17000_c0_seq1:422-715(+)